MSSKNSDSGKAVGKNAETTDPSLDDDNKSDSDEYEYEEIEVEEYEEIVEEESRSDSPLRLTISEVETITPQDEKLKKETLILKSDGTTEIFEKDKKKAAAKVGRSLTTQEESILLPLIQGLLAANGGNDQSKHENTPFREKESTSNAKDNKITSNDNENDESLNLTHGANILGELSNALNRLQTTILEGKEVVSDTRKRNTILTLVAWLKRILQTPANELTTDETCNKAQIFALTDLLPTELLLSKLMPQLSNGNDVNITSDQTTENDGRSPASSKRFSRQRNNRFNTVGVSKEELADARLYLQKKLLTENLASTSTKASTEMDQNVLDDGDDSKRKSLNLSQTKKYENNIENILKCSKGSFSKSVDIAPSDEESSLQNLMQMSKFSESRTITNSKTENEQSIQNHSKVVYRKKSLSSLQNLNNRQLANNDQNATTDSDDDQSNHVQRKSSNGSVGSSSKPMNKFALRKLKMKRANTIDIPKNNNLDEFQSDQNQSDGNKNTNGTQNSQTISSVQLQIQAQSNNNGDKNHLADFQVKSSNDKKFHAFLNRTNDENRLSWLNPNKNGFPGNDRHSRTNWNSKFGNIKNSFEQIETPNSPKLNKKNNFTHAPTSPFKPVQNSKPPQIPNGSYLYHNSNQQVMRKIAAIQNNEHKENVSNQSNMKPQLKTHQSLPIYADESSPFRRGSNDSNSRSNDRQQNKYSSVDNYVQHNNSLALVSTAYNPLYEPPSEMLSPMSQRSPMDSRSPMGQRSPMDSRSPMIQRSLNKMSVSQASMPNEFPSYTYTCTDYTQPTAVSTFGPESVTPPIKTKILPDTSYLKNPPTENFHPSLGSSALNMQMKTIDLHSSSEYLSEPSYFRSPQPFSPTYEYNQMQCYDSQPESREFTAKSQIMQYPNTQTATYINKNNDYHHRQAQSLHGYPTSNIRQERKYSGSYSEKNSSISPFSDGNSVQINRTYVPPPQPSFQNNHSKAMNNFMSMENISSTKFEHIEPGQPLRLKNNTAYYGSHAALSANQHRMSEIQKRNLENTKATPLKLNSAGGQYIQPKVETNLDKSGPTFGRKDAAQTNVIKNNVTNLNRSQTITHQRMAQADVKRKQSLPAQGSDYFDSVYNPNEVNLPPTHNYLPAGVLKRSKSSHTLALLQQFEGKTKTSEAPLPSYVKKPTISAPMIDIKPKSILVNAQRSVTNTPKQIFPQDDEVLEEPRPKPAVQPRPAQTLPFDGYKPKVEPIINQIIEKQDKPEIIQPKVQPIVQPIEKPIVKSEPTRETVQETRTAKTEVSSKSVEGATVKTEIKAEVVMRKKQQLQAPEPIEPPASPSVEDGHIIYPGQTVETRNRVQHYAQTLNAMLNRKSIVLEDEEAESDKNESGKMIGLQKSKSGTLLGVPKQYESAIRKSEVEEKQRTVAAYFSANKSPLQNLQRSSSQHSVLSSSSFKSAKDNSNPTSPSQVEEVKESADVDESVTTRSTAITTSTKSSHHLKILRRQQKSTMNTPLAKSQTLPSINLLDESNVDDAFEDLFASFNARM